MVVDQYYWEALVGAVILIKGLLYLIYKIQDKRMEKMEAIIAQHDRRMDKELTTKENCQEFRESMKEIIATQMESLGNKILLEVRGIVNGNGRK